MLTIDAFKPLMVRVEAWWPGTKWDEAMIAVWFEELARFPLDQVREALESLKRTHLEPFAPPIGAVLKLLEGRSDPSLPTFDEMLALIYRAASKDDRMVWLERQSPPVFRFVCVQGERVFTTEFDDPEFGALRRKELLDAWERFLERGEQRAVAAIASGGGLKRLDPLSATGQSTPQLER